MAVSCAEVMYGAYYPYLYGRGAARSFHHPTHHFHHYDRFNVQSGVCSGEQYGGAGAGGAVSTGSGSSGGHSPASPALPPTLPSALRAKEEDLSLHNRPADGGGSSESEGECGNGADRERHTQYVSANCVVFTHYSGDVAAVVDEHFTRALSVDKAKDSIPMVSRNLPPSFFNASCAGGAGNGAGGSGEMYEYEWGGASWGGGYRPMSAWRDSHVDYHHNMYTGLLLPRPPLHHQYKPVGVDWAHHQHHLDPAAAYASYPSVHGLEAQVQDSSKDLYWF